jgi:hypothetical protein
MRRRLLGSLFTAAAALVVPTAVFADDTIVVLPPGSTQPQPQPPPPPPTSPSGTPGTVHANFHALRGKSTFVYRAEGEDHWVTVCSAPCEADLPPATRLRVVYDGNDEEPHDFTLDGNAGSRTDVEVRPASKGALAGGIVMTSVGGLTALIGLLLAAVSTSDNLTTNDKSSLGTAGFVCIVIGGGLTVGGILVMVNRSREPRVKQDTDVHYYKGREPYGLLDDVPSHARVAIPLPPTPLGATIHF